MRPRNKPSSRLFMYGSRLIDVDATTARAKVRQFNDALTLGETQGKPSERVYRKPPELANFKTLKRWEKMLVKQGFSGDRLLLAKTAIETVLAYPTAEFGVLLIEYKKALEKTPYKFTSSVKRQNLVHLLLDLTRRGILKQKSR